MHGPLPAPLPDWLAHRAASTPARTALVAEGRTWSYAELEVDVARAARRLAATGVRAGHRVATLLHNGAAPALLVHAVLRLGATLVPLNVRLGARELAWQLGDAAPRLLVVEERTAPLADAAVADAALREHAVSTLDASRLLEEDDSSSGIEADDLESAHDPEHVLAIIYTSGTTGQPKGAMLTVGNFWWSATGSALNLGALPEDRWLACLPLFHVGGLSILLRAAIHGFTAVVHDGFDAAAVNRALDEEGVTTVSVVAVMLQRMLDLRDDHPYPATLRWVLLGGGPAPRPLLERCARLGVPVVQTYGLTETASQVATLAPEDALHRLGSAGRPLYPNALRIVRPDGSDAAVDEAGEIAVRGPVVMAGYAGRPEETARAIVDGWLHTGDVGRLDADGYLYVLDRRDDLIVTGGENVYPAEVEAALLAHPAVADAAVIGVPDDAWGRRVVAVVRLAESATASAAEPAAAPGGRTRDGIQDELTAHCRSRLAGYKVPREIRIAAEPLPRTASGKLRRAEVRRAELGGSGTPPAEVPPAEVPPAEAPPARPRHS